MAAIGILADNPNETAGILSRICQENGQSPRLNHYKTAGDNVIPIVSIDENYPSEPEALILPDQVKTKDKVITYGFNGKASVTASSVAENSIQVCIQRGFTSLSGKAYEPQEFTAPCPEGANPLNVLGAITACAVCDLLS